MELFYKPQHALVGDVIPYYEDGQFYLFYLKNWDQDYKGEDRKPGWHLLETKDLVHYDSERAIDIIGGTGCVIKVDGLYHLYYCIFENDPQRQYVCHATSPDLKEWTKYPEETFGPNENIYLLTDWRDPHVIWNEEEQCYWMLLCAQNQGKSKRRGCVGLCKSTDLHHWTCCQPLYAPESSMSAYECPDIFYENGWWYLVFSQFTDRFRTLYRMSRSINGPWIRPQIDSFDSRAYYAAKTCSDGEHRYVFGWNPTRTRNIWDCDFKGFPGGDGNTWDWGGSLLPHEIWQDEDGCLYVKPVDAVMKGLAVHKTLDMHPLTGDWKLAADCAASSSPYGYASLLLNPVEKSSCLSFDVKTEEGTAMVGVAIHVDEEFSQGYYINIDLWHNRIEFKSTIRMTERGGQMFPFDVELEQMLPQNESGMRHVDILVSGTILTAYVDRKVALSARLYNREGGNFGLFVTDGEAEFENVVIGGER